MGDQLPRLTGGGKPSHPRLTGGGGGTQVRRLVANEQFVTPKNFSQPKPKPAPKKSHGFLGGIVQGVEHAAHKVEHVAADAYHQQAGPSKPGLLSNAKGPGIGKQLSVVSGLPSGIFTHPIGFIHHQQHLSPQDKANSAIGAHVLGALFGAPVAGRVSGAAARRGEAVAFSGGGKDAEGDVVHPTLYHGSPEGELGNIDALHHTRPWREGPGFYATTSPEKAAKYAEGKTASADRKVGKGAINVVKLKPGTKVLNLDTQGTDFWRELAGQIVGEPVSEETWKTWASDIEAKKGASEGILNRQRLLHLLTGWDDMPNSDAYYAIEEALHSRGVQATLHHEGGVPVYIIKDADAIERHGLHVPEVKPEPAPTPPPIPEPVPAGDTTHPLLRPAVSTEQMAKDVRDRLAGKVPGLGEYEKVGAHLDDPNFGKSAAQLRKEQDILYSQERGKRAAAGAEVMQQVGGVSGHRAALNELKGELPKLKFGGFENFDQSGLDALMNHIQDHPTLQFYDKINAQAAILKVLDGKVPTPSDLKLLHKVFGEDVAKNIHESLPFWQKAKNMGLETLNIPRALMSSMDLSAPFRQGLVVGVTHPVMFAKNFAPMVKAFGSENAYRSVMEDIVTRPTFPLMNDAGLAMNDLGSLETRAEQFKSNYAERLNLREIPLLKGLGKWGTGPGDLVRASDRGYVAFLNKTRADYFDYLLKAAKDAGHTENDRAVLDGIGRYINSATGWGSLGSFEKHAVTLNTLLFSPRLLFSRLNFMNPVYYAKLDPFARKEALKAARNLVGTMGFVLYTAKLAGAHVNDDPRNADFAKIRIGNTRIDLAGGFQQPIRLLAQLSPHFLGGGRIISSTTGRTLTLGPQGPGNLSSRDIIQRFVEGKLGPVPSVVNDFFKHSDFQGQPFSWKKEAYSHMLPLLFQDARDLEKQSGPAAAAGGYALGAFGFGIQSYGPKKNPADKKTGDSILDRLLNSNQGSPGISPEVQKKIDDLLNKP